MAKRIHSFEFYVTTPTRTSPYPLDEWMDGSIWEVERGVDFEGTPRHMQSRLHHYASTRGYRVQTRCVYELDRECVVFQFRPEIPPPP